jgi:hypothetical protein
MLQWGGAIPYPIFSLHDEPSRERSPSVDFQVPAFIEIELSRDTRIKFTKTAMRIR